MRLESHSVSGLQAVIEWRKNRLWRNRFRVLRPNGQSRSPPPTRSRGERDGGGAELRSRTPSDRGVAGWPRGAARSGSQAVSVGDLFPALGGRRNLLADTQLLELGHQILEPRLQLAALFQQHADLGLEARHVVLLVLLKPHVDPCERSALLGRGRLVDFYGRRWGIYG